MTDKEIIERLKAQRDHARNLARQFYEVMIQFPTDISDFGIDPYDPAPGDGWSANQPVKERRLQ